jgi:hypothetical protein
MDSVMKTDPSSVDGNPETAPFTSERLRNLVFDHLLDNSKIFIGDGPGSAQQFVAMFDSIELLAKKIANEAIVNRQNLSDLPTFSSKINADPNHDVNDENLYEMRFRVVEQIGSDAPFHDQVLTRSEATELYGDKLLADCWGEFGENCPKSIQRGELTQWFSVVRYPIERQSADLNMEDGKRKIPFPCPPLI